MLAENPGSSTRLARAATEPSVEYAGALMWNSGSDVISRSSARELHPVREALARHHVGEVRLHHELRAAGRARRRDHHRDVGLVDRGRAAPVGRARSNSAATLASSTTSVGCDLARRSRSSSASRARRVHRHLDRADLHEREPHQQVVGRVARGDEHTIARLHAVRCATRSRRVRPVRAPRAYVYSSSSVHSHTLSGTASTAARNSVGMVRTLRSYADMIRPRPEPGPDHSRSKGGYAATGVAIWRFSLYW